MAVDLCDDLQNFFWRVMFTVPESCPKIALTCETRMIRMKWRIWQDKILLVLRIKNHHTDTLCRQVYDEGRHKSGLSQEVSGICEELGLPDVNGVNVPKSEVRKAIFEHHCKDMVEIVNKQTKLEGIKREDFRNIQEYFDEKSIENSRMSFKIRSQMVLDIPGNSNTDIKCLSDRRVEQAAWLSHP